MRIEKHELFSSTFKEQEQNLRYPITINTHEFKGCKLNYFSRLSHMYCEVIDSDNQSYPVIFIQDAEWDKEFFLLIEIYIALAIATHNRILFDIGTTIDKDALMTLAINENLQSAFATRVGHFV